MKNQTAAKRYAQALISLGIADGKYVAYGQELGQLSAALGGAGDLAKALTSPVYPREVQKKMLAGIVTKASLSPMVSNFVNLLLDKGRLGELADITEAYTALSDAERGIVRAKVSSAVPLSDSEISAITASLSKFAGKAVELTANQDLSIIGGLMAQLGDLTIDGSVRTQLGRLAEKLDSL